MTFNQTIKGSAILTALFIMIIVAIAATAMSLRLQIDINRTQLIKDTQTMIRLGQKTSLDAIVILQNNLNQLSKKVEHIDNTPYRFKPFYQTGFKVHAVLSDEQGKFNLNNLTDRKYINPFARLLQFTNPELKIKDAIAISYAVNEWVSRLNLNKGRTKLDSYYAAKHYAQSHLPMVTPSEFRLIKGVSQKMYLNTLPFITTLPKTTPINLNSASLPVLQTLGAGLSEKQAQEIIKARGKKGFLSSKAFQEHETIKPLKLTLKAKDYTLTSQYFLSYASITGSSHHFLLFTRLERKINKKWIDTHILQQTINTV